MIWLLGGSLSRDVDKFLPRGKIQDHSAAISTARHLEILCIPAVADHFMIDISDEVDPIIGVSESFLWMKRGSHTPQN